MMVSSDGIRQCHRVPTIGMLPIPATFIIGTDGSFTARFIDPDYRMRMAIEDLLAALGPRRSFRRRLHSPVATASVRVWSYLSRNQPDRFYRAPR